MKSDSAWNPSELQPRFPLWREAAPYLLAIVMIVLTLLARSGLGVAFGERPLLILFVFPIIISAHVGGLGPGLAATFLAAFSVDFFLVPPKWSFYISQMHDLVQWLMLVVSGVLISLLNEALRRSRQRVAAGRQTLAAALVGMADALITSDARGRVELLNPEARRLTGWSQGEAQGQPLSEVLQILDDDEQRPLVDLVPFLLRGGSEALPDGMFLLQARDGSQTPISLSHAPIRDDAGQVTGLVLTFHDRSAEREAQRELRLWADAFRFSGHGMAIGLPGDNTFLACNPAFARMLGRKVQEMAGLPILTIYDPADRERVAQCFAECDATGQVSFEAVMLRADGSRFPVQIDLVSVRDGQGRLRYRVSSAQDITLRRQEEARLESLLRISQLRADSEQELLDAALEEALALTNSSLGYIFHYREDEEEFQLNTWSKRVAEQCQVDEPREISRLAHTGIWAEMLQQRAPLLINHLQDATAMFKARPAGHVPLERICAIPVFLDAELIAVAAVANKPVDYTAADLRQLTLLMEAVWKFLDRLRALQGLKESEARFQALVENAPDAIFIQTDQRFAYANQAALRLFGADSAEQLLDQPVLDRFHPADRSQVRERIRRLNQEHQAAPVAEERCLRLDGSSVDVEASAVPFQYQGRAGALVFLRDVSERKRARDTLEANEKRLHTILEAIADPVVVYNHQEQVSFVNPAFSRVFGWRPEEVLGRRVPPVPPEQQGQADALFTELLAQGGTRNQEAKLAAKNGEVRNVLISAAGIPGPEGEQEGLVVNISDVSLTRRLEAQLRQSQKMEAIGTLAGGIAHDFNNILAAIMGYAEIAQENAKEGRPPVEELALVLQSATRARDLVKQILTFSRKAEADLKPMNLNATVGLVLKMLVHSLPKMIGIETDLAPNLPLISADANQMEQVLLNLATNAGDAMAEGGRLLIETHEVVLGAEYCAQHLEARPGRHVLLQVSDNGHGIAGPDLEHIFDPFFTTKAVGKGTGLGLSTVYGIVRNHGGHVYCYSELDLGTTFKVYLPVEPAPGQADQVEPALPEQLLRGTETVLVVDDEPALRQLAGRTLEGMSYRVLTAANGEEALALYQGQGQEIDLVVMDLGMPGMGGHKCLKEILNLNPAAKVVIASGYSANGQVKASLESGAVGYVAKPYRKVDLLTTVRGVLDGG